MILTVPGVLGLRLPGHGGHVQQHLQPGRHLVLAAARPRLRRGRAGTRAPVAVRVADAPRHVAAHGAGLLGRLVSSCSLSPLLVLVSFLLPPSSSSYPDLVPSACSGR